MRTDTERDARRLLILANAACTGSELFQVIRDRVDGPDAEVLIVAPALASRLNYWMSDEDAGIEAAGRRLSTSLEHCGAAGIPARGALGDADPLQALDDAMRSFAPDEVVIATHPAARSNWLEHGLVNQARERFPVQITHVEVDVDRDAARIVDAEPRERAAPPRERHTRRDLGFLLVAWILAIGGSALSWLLYAAGVGGWVLGLWVVVFDLGLKLGLGVALWLLFQRRPRADRLGI